MGHLATHHSQEHFLEARRPRMQTAALQVSIGEKSLGTAWITGSESWAGLPQPLPCLTICWNSPHTKNTFKEDFFLLFPLWEIKSLLLGDGKNLVMLHLRWLFLWFIFLLLETAYWPRIFINILWRKVTAKYDLPLVVVSDFLWPHGLQHARLPSPSLSLAVRANSCALSQWCHPTISSSVVPFSSRLQFFPASGSFPMSQFFSTSSQSIGVSASASVLPVNIQGWFPLGLPGLNFLLSKGLSRVFSSITIQKHQFLRHSAFFMVSHIRTWFLETP